VPPPQAIRALIDTGADRTAIHPKALALIASPPTGTILVRRANPATARRGNLHDVRLAFGGALISPARGPWVEVGADRNGAIFVRDRGAGFDMKYAETVFEPFQRLAPDSDTPGSGIGLAIVQKIAERHGGRAWPMSVPGIGTTFYLELAGPARVGRDPDRYRSAA